MNPRLARWLRPAADLGWLLLPFALVLLAYKLHQLWPAAWRGPVRIAEPRAWELAWFGLHDGTALVTPAAWWQPRTHPLLDAIAGVAYLIFVPAFIAMAAWWRFAPAPPAVRTARSPLAQRAMWALLLLYVAGYATYLAYPAAPPWYYDRYGAALVAAAPPDAAGTLRFDALIGFPLFANYYGKSLNIFGAIPSLHCGTSLLALLYALRARSWRLFAAAQLLAVTFGAVYLNHHYLVDAVVGFAYAAAAFAVLESRSLSRRG